MICGIIFPRNDISDVTGCLKLEAHNDAHVCQSSDGNYYEWEDDYNCTCGCWDEFEKTDGLEKPCVIYSKIKWKK